MGSRKVYIEIIATAIIRIDEGMSIKAVIVETELQLVKSGEDKQAYFDIEDIQLTDYKVIDSK